MTMNAKIATNKSLLKEYKTSYGRTVYLADNTEFQIQLFNPETCNIGIEILINDKHIGNMLVLKPGQRVWLERYLDEARKFVFTTYEVESDIDNIENIISHNGNITIRFYRERTNVIHYDTISAPIPRITTYPRWGNDIVYCNYSAVVGNSVDTPYGTCYSNSASSTISDCTLSSFNELTINEPRELNSTIETGRIEKGSHSSQAFNEISMEFEPVCYDVENIKILPISQKPTYASDLSVKYCYNCGKKLSAGYKFCPSCGTNVQ